MNKILRAIAICLSFLVMIPSAFAEDKATANDAVALVKKAVASYVEKVGNNLIACGVYK